MPKRTSEATLRQRQAFHPESLMMTYGYKPELSEGALKVPIFQTSSFVFRTAEEGKAFRLLNALRLIKLAVSLGGTESLAEHPYSMTHADVTPQAKQAAGITDRMIHLSVGIEHPDDVIADLTQALAQA